MKRCILSAVVLFSGFLLYSQNVDSISDMSLEEFYKLPVKSSSELQTLYLWNGIISEIRETDSGMEVVILKARWISTGEIRAFHVILKIEDPEMRELIKKIGQYKRVSFLTRVRSLHNGIPVCVPIKLYKF